LEADAADFAIGPTLELLLMMLSLFSMALPVLPVLVILLLLLVLSLNLRAQNRVTTAQSLALNDRKGFCIIASQLDKIMGTM
jgi:hypothetical protein